MQRRRFDTPRVANDAHSPANARSRGAAPAAQRGDPECLRLSSSFSSSANRGNACPMPRNTCAVRATGSFAEPDARKRARGACRAQTEVVGLASFGRPRRAVCPETRGTISFHPIANFGAACASCQPATSGLRGTHPGLLASPTTFPGKLAALAEATRSGHSVGPRKWPRTCSSSMSTSERRALR